MITRHDAQSRLAIFPRVSVCALLALGLLAASASATDEPKLIYRKVFKSSSPEFVEVTITPAGTGVVDIRQLDDDPDPQPIEFSPQFVARLFEMAAELKHFNGIELDVKVGFGETASDVPEPLRQAIRLLTAHWYENRGAVASEAGAPLPRDAAALIATYRVPTL